MGNTFKIIKTRFVQHMKSVLLQPAGEFIQFISTCLSGQLTRTSVSLGQSVDDRGR